MADIPAVLRSWSATAASNQPTDSTTVGSGLDDNLRTIQSVVRQFLGSYGSNIASAATMDLSTMDGYAASVTGNTTVTGLGTEAAGISYLLTFASTPMFKSGSNLIIGGSDLTFAAGDVATFISEGSGAWRMTGFRAATGTTGTGAIVRTASPTITTPAITTPAITGGSLTSVVADTAAADSNTSVVANTAFVLGQSASQSEMETASSTTKFASAGRVKYNPGVAKFWVQFDGTGSIAASHNVSSVTDNGPGDWTINLTTAFSTATYAVAASLGSQATSPITSPLCIQVGTHTVSAVRIFTVDSTGSLAEAVGQAMFVSGFGDQ